MKIWIGRFHIKQGKSLPLGNDVGGAYTNVVGRAADQQSFISLVREVMAEDDLQIADFEDVSRVEVYRKEGRLDRDLERLIGLARTEYPVQWTTWHLYPPAP